MTEDGASGEHWDGYSLYYDVSEDIHSSVGQAIDSYSKVVASHSEGAKIRSDEAADHKAAILAAAYRLLTEMEVEVERGSSNKGRYERILADWDPDDGQGWLLQLHEHNLHQSCPDWLHDFVREIHQAAWHLGYLKAGRTETDTEGTPEASGREMIEDIAHNAALESDA